MMAFSNFFYVIDYKENYIDRQWDSSEKDISLRDSLLSVIFISLGDFSPAGYYSNHSVESAIVWFFFLLATFMMLIVFMNLLITIIGNKFDEVMEI